MNKAQQIKDIIEQAKSSFVSVTFTKKDGSERTMQFNPKTVKGLKGEDACEERKKTNATRAAQNPDLIYVQDHQLLLKGSKPERCWRGFQCDSVISMKAGGNVYKFN